MSKLHDIEVLINLNPLVQSWTPLTDEITSSHSYKIIDRLNLCGITFQKFYTATFVFLDDDVTVSTKATPGVRTTNRWIVEEYGDKKGEAFGDGSS